MDLEKINITGNAFVDNLNSKTLEDGKQQALEIKSEIKRFNGMIQNFFKDYLKASSGDEELQAKVSIQICIEERQKLIDALDLLVDKLNELVDEVGMLKEISEKSMTSNRNGGFKRVLLGKSTVNALNNKSQIQDFNNQIEQSLSELKRLRENPDENARLIKQVEMKYLYNVEARDYLINGMKDGQSKQRKRIITVLSFLIVVLCLFHF
ncbi:hypothetical protein MADA3029_740094 [Vibrio nigripulchritudo MADA3029]|uniref:hypothetical protein n=1 Tax=Vibrio nigripulchritudo TaxID=28173 RepID=UPI0003B18D9C|nr:hypothetical protein [Vibrio nigripulchritudo]CCN49188.1 hypothetical protein VIBNIMADA3020_710027 [Vibrio nigripulchritudo MADA3020]CCN54173.1 hypothetical protein VIBNIMADA3021_510096 [Vibrio nigripulchritudo MADA3021]CCN61243.1 hypothetical protein MADA3029_740094 [Vibrio nigripulchritudo MADA3029]